MSVGETAAPHVSAEMGEWLPNPRIIAIQSQTDTLEAQEARQQAWTSIYLEHSPQLSHYAAILCRDQHVAEDLVQLTFERAFKNIGSFESRRPTSLVSWLGRIIYNAAIDYIREAGRRLSPVDTALFERSTRHRVNSPSPESTDPFTQVAFKETLGELEDELLPTHRTDLFASLMGVPIAENAALHNTTTSSINGKIHRGRIATQEVIRRAA